MKKKLFLATTLLSIIPLAAIAAEVSSGSEKKEELSKKESEKKGASDFVIKIGGSLHPQFGIANVKEDFKYSEVGKKDSAKLKNHSIVNKAGLNFGIEAGNSETLKYGAVIEINADSSEISGDKAMLFLEGRNGRLEIGSYDGVGERLRVSPARIARATGGIDGDYLDWAGKGAYKTIDLTGLFNTAVYAYGSNESRSNKITYYSPNFSGLSFGISYAPDTEVTGKISSTRDTDSSDFVSEKGLGFKNLVEAGVRYERNINEDLGVSLSLMGEFGKAKTKDFKENGVDKVLKRHDALAVELGARVDYKGFSVAGSYCDLGKSGGIKSVSRENADLTADYIAEGKKPKGSFWTLGAAYELNDFGFSVTYYNSKAFGKVVLKNSILSTSAKEGHSNKFNALSFGVDYKVLPGMLAYAEYTNFKFSMNDSYLGSTGGKDTKLNKGNIILTGLKFEF